MTSTTADAPDAPASEPSATTRPTPPGWLQLWHRLVSYLMADAVGGPKVIKLAWVINLQKGATGLFVLGLMAAYDNFGVDAWVYCALHGSYGLIWLMKHLAFRDASWEVKVTIPSAIIAWGAVLAPYWIAPVLVVTDVLGERPPAPPWMLGLSIFLYAMGVSIMVAADAQKHFVLKHKRGLIDDGMFARVRNPNYLGEMLLYASFALLARHFVPWVVLGFVWSVLFMKNMLMKDVSLSRHPGWAAYKKRSGLLTPWL